MIDCANPTCGLDFDPVRADGLYYEDDEHACVRCGAVNLLGVEDDGEPYVMHLRCRHGVSGEEKCTGCDEEPTTVAEGASQ